MSDEATNSASILLFVTIDCLDEFAEIGPASLLEFGGGEMLFARNPRQLMLTREFALTLVYNR